MQYRRVISNPFKASQFNTQRVGFLILHLANNILKEMYRMTSQVTSYAFLFTERARQVRIFARIAAIFNNLGLSLCKLYRQSSHHDQLGR